MPMPTTLVGLARSGALMFVVCCTTIGASSIHAGLRPVSKVGMWSMPPTLAREVRFETSDFASAEQCDVAGFDLHLTWLGRGKRTVSRTTSPGSVSA